MAEGLSAAERQRVIDQRLDELDRLLLGLLSRTERLAIVTDVEARVKALGGDVSLVELPAVAPATVLSRTSVRPATRRSRVALSSGVLGIISAACLLISPILFIVASMCAEILGEEITIALMGLFVFVLVVGGGLAVFLGGASIIRLTRQGQTTTGTGWAITGLCTGMLPMLLGGISLLTLGIQFAPATYVSVTPGPLPAHGPVMQSVQHSGYAASPPVYAQPVEWNAKAPPGMPMPMSNAPLPSGVVPPLPAKESKKEAAQPERKPLPAALPEEDEEKLGIDFEE